MKKSPQTFYAHILKSALGVAGGLLLCGARSYGADVFFSLDDTNQDAKIVVVGTVGGAGFVDSGGVTNSRFLKLTDATGQSAAVLFPDFEPGFIVASFTFECMIKCGDWDNGAPADGFSVNFSRAGDTIIAE